MSERRETLHGAIREAIVRGSQTWVSWHTDKARVLYQAAGPILRLLRRASAEAPEILKSLIDEFSVTAEIVETQAIDLMLGADPDKDSIKRDRRAVWGNAVAWMVDCTADNPPQALRDTGSIDLVAGLYSASRRGEDRVAADREKGQRGAATRESGAKLSRDERERIYHDVLTNPAQPVLPIPEPFAGYDGEYVLAVKLDGAAREMTIRAVWKPDAGFWHRNAEKMIPPETPVSSAEDPVPDTIIQDRPTTRFEIPRRTQSEPEPRWDRQLVCVHAGTIGCQHHQKCHRDGRCLDANASSMAEAQA